MALPSWYPFAPNRLQGEYLDPQEHLRIADALHGDGDPSQLPSERLVVVAVPEFRGEHDLFVLCRRGHRPIARRIAKGEAPVCPVCREMQDGDTVLRTFTDLAAVRGYERLDD